ncbi:MAG: Rrf2 family transcriptional regulator [Gemmatimonadaceae bacterium]
MWISGTTQYALRAVLHVAEHGRTAPVRVDAIAAALDVPRNYLSKTLHALACLVCCAQDAAHVVGFSWRTTLILTLARVAEPFDDLAQRQCLLRQQACGARSSCPAHARWEAISTSLTTFFGETTVADLLHGRASAFASPPYPSGATRRLTFRLISTRVRRAVGAPRSRPGGATSRKRR